jgi:hypothetical protein
MFVQTLHMLWHNSKNSFVPSLYAWFFFQHSKLKLKDLKIIIKIQLSHLELYNGIIFLLNKFDSLLEQNICCLLLQ